MEIINVEEAPEALGPYCSAIRTGNLLYCSGKTGMNFETNRVEATDVERQTRAVMESLKSVLADQGLTVANVVRCNVHLSDMANFQTMNSVLYTYWLLPHARTYSR